MYWCENGKVAFLVTRFNDINYHIPWFPLDYYKSHPNWIERLISSKLDDGEVVIIKDFGYKFPIPASYNDIPVFGEQLSLEL